MKGSNNPLRRPLGQLLSFINLFMLNLSGITDTQCGFKFFKAGVAKKLFNQLTIYRWLFDIEILSLAIAERYKISKKPVSWVDTEGSKVNILRDLPLTMKNLLTLYIRFALLKTLFISAIVLSIMLYIFLQIF